jgi:hypothetical protein
MGETSSSSESAGLVSLADDLLRPELTLASPADVEIPRRMNTADEAIALLRERHAQWIAAQ